MTKRKSGNERFVPIHENIFDWLQEFRNDAPPTAGRVIDCSVGMFRRLFADLHKQAGVELIPNGMRKSGISYYLAAYPEYGVAQVSRRVGNSEASCRQHYLKVLTKEDGLAWFKCPGQAFGAAAWTPGKADVIESVSEASLKEYQKWYDEHPGEEWPDEEQRKWDKEEQPGEEKTVS
jgi:hypothetical protein